LAARITEKLNSDVVSLPKASPKLKSDYAVPSAWLSWLHIPCCWS